MQSIENLEKAIKINKTNRDYCCDKSAAQDLAQKIQDYWHTRGHHSVRIWLEKVNSRGKTRWEIKGNITFKTPE